MRNTIHRRCTIIILRFTLILYLIYTRCPRTFDTTSSLNNFNYIYSIKNKMHFYKSIWWKFSLNKFHKRSKVIEKFGTVYKNTTNVKRVLQTTSFFINDHVMSISKIIPNSQCTDPIFSLPHFKNLLLVRSLLPRVFFFYIYIFTSISGVCDW